MVIRLNGLLDRMKWPETVIKSFQVVLTFSTVAMLARYFNPLSNCAFCEESTTFSTLAEYHNKQIWMLSHLKVSLRWLWQLFFKMADSGYCPNYVIIMSDIFRLQTNIF